jgi:hypothetical protein
MYIWFITLLFSVQTKYYVATNGNDNNAGTSVSAPFATVEKAISKAVHPGDSIFVRSGTYIVNTTIRITKPGTAAKHIVLTVYPPDLKDAGARPVFDCSAMPAGSSNRGFVLADADYWDIYGIIIKGAGDNGMNIDHSSHVRIEFCSFLRNRDSGLQIGNLSSNVKVINCDAYDNADRGTGTKSAGGNADGFAPKIDVGDSVFFIGCRAWMNSDDGWDGYLRGASDNMTTYLENCWAFSNGYYWEDGSTTAVQNGNGFKLGGSDTKDKAHNFVLANCVSFYNKAKGFDQNSNAGSIYLYDCSAYQNGGYDYGLTSSLAIYKSGAVLVLKNNMSSGAKGVSIPAVSTPQRSVVTSGNSFSTDVKAIDTTGVTAMRQVDGSLPRIILINTP